MLEIEMRFTSAVNNFRPLLHPPWPPEPPTFIHFPEQLDQAIAFLGK